MILISTSNRRQLFITCHPTCVKTIIMEYEVVPTHTYATAAAAAGEAIQPASPVRDVSTSRPSYQAGDRLTNCIKERRQQPRWAYHTKAVTAEFLITAPGKMPIHHDGKISL